jgi:hypothetical protein
MAGNFYTAISNSDVFVPGKYDIYCVLKKVVTTANIWHV